MYDEHDKSMKLAVMITILLLACVLLSIFAPKQPVEGEVVDRWQEGRSNTFRYVSIRVDDDVKAYMVPDAGFWSTLDTGETVRAESYCTPLCCQCLVESE
jgi:hypothetical protein